MSSIGRQFRRLRRHFEPRGNVDALAGNRLSGWAFSGSRPVRINARAEGRVIASVAPDIVRNDVALAFPDSASARNSGFRLEIPEDSVPANGIVNIVIEAETAGGMGLRRELAQLSIAGPGLVERLSNAEPSGTVGPFPQRVIDIVVAAWRECRRDVASVEGQRAFVGKLIALLQVAELRSIPAIADYARYLHSIWSHFNFVDQFFPGQNMKADQSSADFHCKPNSVFEILSIAHQLYVLKSYGVEGAFAEFGCFKGFSSSMLSHACAQLDIPMHIFDSFEGLPPAEGSGYSAGEYAGSLEEVSDHVRRFGAIADVTFHQGFFADTFRTYRAPPLMCLWMDVDLEVSAQDMLVALESLDPRSTLFSHECLANMFSEGEILTEPRQDNPIPPMLARFEEMGRPMTGRFMRGNTGAFWARQGGIPAMDNQLLVELVKALP